MIRKKYEKAIFEITSISDDVLLASEIAVRWDNANWNESSEGLFS